MRKQIFSMAVVCGVVVLLMAVPAFAQIPGTELHAKIPFDFIVRGRTLPAGTYDIRRISDGPDGLVIENQRDRRDHIMFETEPISSIKSPRHGELIFHRYGDSYFLSQIWSSADDDGRRLPPSHQERILKRESAMASRNEEPETVAIATF